MSDSGKRILIVDDDRSNASVVAKLLTRCGYETTFELSAERALKAAAALRPDVVITDLSLPDMSGYDLARRLRKHANGMQKIIALTGHAPEHADGDDSIFDEYLSKPADIKTLRKAIDGG